MRKHQCQDRLSLNQPPSVGPTAVAPTTAMRWSANPWLRFAGGKAAARIDCATGVMPPPARPWMTRKTSKDCRFHAKPQSRELAVNIAMQTRKKFLRPNISAIQPLAHSTMGLATKKGELTQEVWSLLTAS